ncbi:MAG: sugar O-acetyltransferase [Methanocorpusculum sp.]|nr:sugar O-acetyltransferase [Methanocorpusculum sp.]
MTERDKQLAGLGYNSLDEELRTLQARAYNLTLKLNAVPAGNPAKKDRLVRKLFGSVGVNLTLCLPIHVDFGCNIFVGDNCLINMNCTFLDSNKIIIGDRVLIAPDVKIYTAGHPIEGEERSYDIGGGKTWNNVFAKPVKIGNDVWIGGGSVILPGITIGNNVVVGAGSVVTHDIEDNSVAVGNPCRIIRKLNGD